jgi:large subunit ribosomal protein L28
MARICSICGKGPRVANLVSNANNRVKRWVFPNVHAMRFTLSSVPNGKVLRGCVCTKCLKSGKVEKVL